MNIASFEFSPTEIYFLDLVSKVVDNQLITSTYFKPTDRNSYTPVDCCHHRNNCSVLLSQFLRLRRNCTNIKDFEIQASLVKNTFLEKGYLQSDLDQEVHRAREINRSELFQDTSQVRNKGSKNFKWSLFTSFSIQHWEMKHIFNKHWRVLKNDYIIGPLLPEKADVIYRGAPSLQMQIAPSIINPPSRPTFFHNWATLHVKNLMYVAIMYWGERKQHLLHQTLLIALTPLSHLLMCYNQHCLSSNLPVQ